MVRTAKPAVASKRTSVEVDPRAEPIQVVDGLQEQLGFHSRADLIHALFWIEREQRRGRRIVSLDPGELDKVEDAVDLVCTAGQPVVDDPTVEQPAVEQYEYLWARPHPWRQQLSLVGRSMNVGQLVAQMNANQLTPEEAAEDFDLPLAQIHEALAYYDAHSDLVDFELREDQRRMRAKGYQVDSPPLP